MKFIVLDDWSQFTERLSAELQVLGHSRIVTIRNFERTTTAVDRETLEIAGDDIDRLELVKATGTDRTADSDMWNAPGHDHDHDALPSGKAPNEIIYAYSATVAGHRRIVHLEGEDMDWDLTEGLGDDDGILVYDRAKLHQAAKNKYWFRGDPRDALLLVVVLR